MHTQRALSLEFILMLGKMNVQIQVKTWNKKWVDLFLFPECQIFHHDVSVCLYVL